MYLEVTAAGGKYWRMKYRYAGKEKRLALGVYPVVSLAEARRKRDQARNGMAAGEDPGQVRREAKLSRAILDATSFEKVALQWWEHWKGPRSPRHAEYVKRRLQADVFPVLGAQPMSSITAPQLLAGEASSGSNWVAFIPLPLSLARLTLPDHQKTPASLCPAGRENLPDRPKILPPPPVLKTVEGDVLDVHKDISRSW
jgi:hypothetical protein